MKKLLNFCRTHKKTGCLTAGLLLSCFFMTPFLLLGTGSIITYHDQLDGELFSYLLTAKYLFTDIRVYPEIMNGLPATGAMPPAPLFVLLYAVFEPFAAFLLSQWILYLIAFGGMYLLLRKLTQRNLIAFGIAVIFMLLPFYPVYGLCIPGQPLLLFSVLSLFEKETLFRLSSPAGNSFPSLKTFSYYLLILFYGVASSLVLVGFACLLLLGFFALFQTVTAICRKKGIPLSPWFSFGLLLLTYIITNAGLLRQVFFPETAYVSHKTEMVLSSQNFFDYFKEAFTTGISYAQSYHRILFLLIILCAIVFFFRFAAGRLHSDNVPFTGKNIRYFLTKTFPVLLFIFLVCLFYAFYHGGFVTGLRNASDGVMKTFNLDRVCWLLPTAWCVLAGYLLDFLLSFTPAEDSSRPKKNVPASSWKIYSVWGIALMTLFIWGMTVLLHSPLRPNLSKLFKQLKGETYYALDWDNFFAEDIFSQIETAIDKPQDDYRVISIGIYPAAAAYNGFYCLDGYSNNYPLEYKHTFRQIMEGELNKSDYVRDFFDNWGNRCYITTAQEANYYTFEKKWNSIIYDLDLNVEKLKELDCRYIFSAAYLMNAEEKGLSLLREAPFETDDSWYHIYVYVVE